MDRREIADAADEDRNIRRLLESDYILGVHDGGRTGGIRLRDPNSGVYLSNRQELAAPPITALRELQNASLQLEQTDDPAGAGWLKEIFSPGSSLGGARPKANVIHTDGSMWIAKFPSVNDLIDVGAWEMVIHDLGKAAGLNVPEAELHKFSDSGSTYMVKRFDRTSVDGRIHFSSAMTMLGETDYSGNISSYIDIAEVIEEISIHPRDDLRELWSRMIFNVCITDADDHLRNHGFLLQKDGWCLSPCYDVNPAYDKSELSLNINMDSNERDIRLGLEVADLFRMNMEEAAGRMRQIQDVVRNGWRALARKYGIGRREMSLMESAFSESERDV